MRKFFNIWVLGTVCLFYFGPIDWDGRDEPWVALFVGCCVSAFNLGYTFVSDPDKRRYSDYDITKLTQQRWFAISVMLTYAMLSLFHMQITTGQSLGSALRGGLNFNTVYSDYQDFLQFRANVSLTAQLILTLKAIVFPIALVLFCAFFTKSKLVAALFIIPILAFSLARGTDKETVDLVLILGVLSIYYGLNKRVLLFLAIAIPIAFILFIERKIGRFGGDMPNCLPFSNTCFNFDSPLASITPSLEIGYVMAVHYITQGYEGLNLAFNLPWHFNFGLGHLPPLKSQICGISGLLCDISDFRSELPSVGWDTRFRWTSAYTIIADDLHWLLVPLYVYFLGWSLRIAEIDWRKRQNPAALAVIVIIAIFTLYSSANMQIAVNLDWCVATICLLYGKALTVRTSNPQNNHG